MFIFKKLMSLKLSYLFYNNETKLTFKLKLYSSSKSAQKQETGEKKRKKKSKTDPTGEIILTHAPFNY